MHVGFDDSGRLVLTQGWRTFERTQKLTLDLVLHFCFNGEDTLFVTVLQYLGGRVECCSESSSSEEDSSSDEEDEDEENLPRVKVELSDSFLG